MAALNSLAVCLLSASQIVASTPPVVRWHAFMAEASSRFAIPESWIARVMLVESGGWNVRNGGPITSSTGAMGLMQLMPDTYADMRRQYGLGPDPFNPHDNILAGTAFLRAMYVRYGYPNLFAAYHAGPGRFDEFLWERRPLPVATVAYLDHVMSNISAAANIASVQKRPVAKGGLFFFIGTIQAPHGLSIRQFLRGSNLFVPVSSDALNLSRDHRDIE
jgi:soluble lytic murein transglycosylase-like protein